MGGTHSYGKREHCLNGPDVPVRQDAFFVLCEPHRMGHVGLPQSNSATRAIFEGDRLMRAFVVVLALCCIAAEFPDKGNVPPPVHGAGLPRLPNGDVDWNGPPPKVKTFGPKHKYKCLRCKRVTYHGLMWDHQCPFCKVMLVREIGWFDSCCYWIRDNLKLCWDWLEQKMQALK